MLNVENFIWMHFRDALDYGSPVTDLRVNCPFCASRYGKMDMNHKLYISLHKHACHCFRCGYSRSWIGLVMDVTGLDYVQALAELYYTPRAKSTDALKQMMAFAETYRDDRKPKKDRIIFPKGFRKLIDVTVRGFAAMQARCYLRGRGFGESYWDRYLLGISDNMPWRIVIPVEGKFCQARAIFPFIQPKYMSPSISVRGALFNFVALEMYDEVVICEGAFSAMSIGENAIGLLRNKATDEQLGRLVKSSVERFIVALDADARIQSVNLAKSLRRGGKDVIMWQYDDGDPADGGDFQVVVPDLKYEVMQRLGGL